MKKNTDFPAQIMLINFQKCHASLKSSCLPSFFELGDDGWEPLLKVLCSLSHDQIQNHVKSKKKNRIKKISGQLFFYKILYVTTAAAPKGQHVTTEPN